MISVAKFRNFKALQCVDVELSPLTVFVGANSTGKSSILEAIHYVSQIGHKPLGKIFLKARSPRLLATGRHLEHMEFVIQNVNSNELRLMIDLPNLPNPNLTFSLYVRKDGNVTESVIPYSEAHHLPEGGHQDQGVLDDAVLLRLAADEIAKPSYNIGRPRVEYTGEGTASMLAFLKLGDDPGYAKIVDALRSIVPTVTGIRLKPAQIEKFVNDEIKIGDETKIFERRMPFSGHEVFFDTLAGDGLPGALMSEGTLFCLGLLTTLYSPTRTKLILLDDLGSALHPKAQKQVIDIIRQVQLEDPSLQVLATSHSPYLLDCLKPEEVRVTTLNEQGHQICAKLGDHPEFEKWKEVMAPGEFWSMVGEDWLASTTEVAK